MRRQLAPALGMLVLLTLLLGVVYPAVVTSIAGIGFGATAGGSLVEVDGEPVGSRLIGQNFTRPEYFHPRPSAAGEGYDAMVSSGANLGPTNPSWLDEVEERANTYRQMNDLAEGVLVPVDAVTASGSGLDPHISIANARLQAARVALARGLDLAEVHSLIDANIEDGPLGILGEPGVNVLLLNLALDTRP